MKRFILYGAMALGLLSTACSDDFDDGGSQVADADQTYYVNIRISPEGSQGSRSSEGNGTPEEGGTDFDKGTGESAVQNVYLVFYDGAGNVVGDIVPISGTSLSFTEEDAGNSVDRYYEDVVAVKVPKGQSKPSQVICYINPIQPASLQNPLNMIETQTRSILLSSDDNTSDRYFAMSNSVYYQGQGGGVATPADGTKPTIAVNIPDNMLFETKQGAIDALNADNKANVVQIYVERYAAKLTFTTVTADPYETATTLINDESEIPVTLQFNAKRWALNASCRESYVVKSFRQESDASTILPESYSFGALNERINSSFTLNNGVPTYTNQLDQNNAWKWNNSTLHRSHWAISPAYFTSEYPEVSGDVDKDTHYNNYQYYYSYNELIGVGGNRALGYSPQSENPTPRYFHETTVGAKALGSSNPAAAVASVILVGDYTLSLKGTPLDNGTTFYTYLAGKNGNPLVFFDVNPATGNTTGASAVEGGESMLRRFIEQTTILYWYNEETDEYVPYGTSVADITKLVAILDVAAPSQTVLDASVVTTPVEGAEGTEPVAPGTVKIPERYRTLQFKSDVTAADLQGIYIVTSNGGYNTIADDPAEGVALPKGTVSLTEANVALMKQVGYCNRYETGRGYFNIPVRHLGWYRPGNTLNKIGVEFDWNLVRVGDFGIVRNHSYSIEVTEITGLATGIGGSDNPIVPPSESKDYFMAYRVNILQWAVVPTQNVKL